jgi:hypothetical protein
MGIGLAPKLDSFYLSKDETFVQSVPLKQGQTYPAGTAAQIIVRDNSEITLATISGTVSGQTASFSSTDLTLLNSIPHGAKFDLMLNYADGRKVKHAYGIVVRNENRYPLNPTQITTNYALQFTDTFDRLYVGKYWIPRNSSTSISIHDNAGSIPNTLGPDFNFGKDAGALWYTPMNTDSVTVTASLVGAGNGQFTIVVCSDYSMSTWLGLQVEQNLVGYQYLRVTKGTSPTTHTTVPGFTTLQWHPSFGGNTWPGFATNDTITVKYNDQSRTFAAYKNTGLTPIASWTDTNNIIPNGAGYRYIGVSWNTALFSPGPEISSWAAKDGL